jgi:hypothetical protein
MKNNNVQVLVGNPIQDPGEQRFITRFRTDLAERGIRAVLYANFITPGRNQHQIDLLVRTPHRVVLVEIKALSQDLPLFGPVNGDWAQVLPDDKSRSLGKNCYWQARNATFGVSDQMKTLSRSGGVPRGDKHYRHIDTVVGIFPDVPAHSQLQPFDHVKALGYPQLLERLATPGPNLDWDDSHWDAFARHLGVYEPVEETPAERRRRISVEAIADYHRRLEQTLTADLVELVDLPTTLDGGAADRTAIADRLRAARSVVLHAASGAGKTFLARHIAAELTERGEVVIWLRADEYVHGRLRSLLGRSAAPFVNVPAADLIRTAIDRGLGVVLVADGLNECGAEDRGKFLEQLAALRLHYGSRVGVLVTTTSTVTAPDGLDAVTATLGAPHDDARAAVLAVHGAVRPDRISKAFTTPHDLAIAAECESTLQPDATVADLHDLYIRVHAPRESVRDGLRHIAGFLQAQLRSSAVHGDVVAHLTRRDGPHLDPAVVDDVLASPLLDVTPGWVRFRHDLLRDFLAAEALTRSARSIDDLVAHLADPTWRPLLRQVLSVDRVSGRVLDILNRLAKADLFADALFGEFGVDAAASVRHAIEVVLRDAAGHLNPGSARFELVDQFQAEWVTPHSWTALEVALFAAAGMAVRAGMFIDEIGELLDRTDALIAREVHTAGAAGPGRLNALVSATYTPVGGVSAANRLPTTYITSSCETASMFFPPTGGICVASRLLDVSNPGWGRAYLATTVFHPTAPDAAATLPRLLDHAVRLGGYHLELHTLWAVEQAGRGLPSNVQAELGQTLDLYRPDNWALASTRIEALASLGQLEPLSSLDDIRAQIGGVLAAPDDPLAAAAASGIVSNIFEDEDVLGPYCEAVDTLPPRDRTRLILLATSGAEWNFHADWQIRQLVKAAPTGDEELDQRILAVFIERSRSPLDDGPIVGQGVSVFLNAVDGLAKFNKTLPPAFQPLDDNELAWRLVANLLIGLTNPGTVDLDLLWKDLLHTVPHAAVDVLHRLKSDGIPEDFQDSPSPHRRLVAAFPDQIRKLLEWALDHLDDLTSLFDRDFRDGPQDYAVRTLGLVGDRTTLPKLRAVHAAGAHDDAAVAAIRNLNERLANRRA